MKVVSDEERRQHNACVREGGLKGAALGIGISIGVVGLLKKKMPARFNGWTWSVKTAVCVIPPAFCIFVGGANASQHFSEAKYNANENITKAETQKAAEWNAMTGRQKALQVLNDNKYKVITGLWALSLWGSWEYANRDKLLSKAQKFYNARMYAQFVTIILLLGSIGLSMADAQKADRRNVEEQADDDFLREIMAEQPDKKN